MRLQLHCLLTDRVMNVWGKVSEFHGPEFINEPVRPDASGHGQIFLSFLQKHPAVRFVIFISC